MRKISKIEISIPSLEPRKKVAAYARVSKETDLTMHSVSAQVSYYNNLIQSNPEWEYAGVYTDSGISGTRIKYRTGFQDMLTACEEGKIDVILTKSISRFARNTVDLLETVRHLKSLGIEVRFEKERVNTLTADGELMLTILASYAQEEVETMSQNIKWTIKKHFEKGRLNGCCSFLGYQWDDTEKKLVIKQDEAETVRIIFTMYRDGYSLQNIVDTLHEEGRKPVRADSFEKTSISQILKNITYTGNLLLQKTFSQDPITKKSRWNKGELPQYYSENTHEAIIDMETFNAVQERFELIHEHGNSLYYKTRAFSRKIVCGICGKHYSRVRSRNKKPHITYTNYYWTCYKRKQYGRKGCTAEWLSEKRLIELSCEVLGWDEFDDEAFREKVNKIYVDGNKITFELSDKTRKEVSYV